MRNHSLNLVVGAGLGVGLVRDPFAPSRLCAAGRHPRRDEGGHPNGGGGTQPPEGGTPPGGGGTQPPEGGTSGGGGGTPPADDWASTFEGMTPAQVKEALEHSRKWESRAKENRPKAEKYDQLLASLNGDGAGGSTPPTPEQLTTDLTAARQGERDAKLESAVLRSAARQNANGDRLTDSNSFMAGIRALDLDPSAADFATKIDGAVKAAVDADKSLSTALSVGAYVGAEGGTPGSPPSREALIADAESKGDHMKAMSLKMAGFAEQSRKK